MPRLTRTEKRTISQFKAALQAAFPAEFDRLLLFGSKARGDHTPDSDVDLLVILNGPADWHTRGRIIRIATRLFAETGVDLSPTIYSRRQIVEMRRRHAMFLQSVERDATPV